MSKIYEALQRAELERLKAREKGAEPRPNSFAVPITAPPEITNERASIGLWESVSPLLDIYPVVQIPVTEQLDPDLSSVEYPPQVPEALPGGVESRVQSSETLLDASKGHPTAALPSGPKFRRELWTPLMDRLPALQERGVTVEQFRTLRSRLTTFRDQQSLKTLLVSSGLPKEGKSFVASNLAVSFARRKANRVLLIDGDMRRSSLHLVLGCQDKPGLSKYLSGEASLFDVIQQGTFAKTADPQLRYLESIAFIGGGGESDKAAELSGSPRFKQLLQDAGELFDWIIIDSSPVNIVSDGVNLAHACDGVLLVARSGVTKLESAQRAVGELKAARMLGVVLNAVTKEQANESYYGYSGYDSE